MFLKNYTSEVPVHQTIHRIEQVLITCGVSGIEKQFGPNGVVIAVTFSIKFESACHPLTVRLPAKVAEAHEVLWREYAGADLAKSGDDVIWGSRKKRNRKSFAEQAERTAWKLVQDWVEVQMSMIQLKQADIREVFLAYIWDGRETFFDRLQANGFRALLPEKSESDA